MKLSWRHLDGVTPTQGLNALIVTVACQERDELAERPDMGGGGQRAHEAPPLTAPQRGSERRT
jgi:hypothetical protein